MTNNLEIAKKELEKARNEGGHTHRNHPNPFTEIKAPTRVVKNERQILDVQEIEEMISQTSSSQSAPLHAALIATNFYAVLRLNEFLKARIEDF